MIASGSPTFADLCDGVLQARLAVRRATERCDAAKAETEAAAKSLWTALNAEDAAKDAFDAFIDRETGLPS